MTTSGGSLPAAPRNRGRVHLLVLAACLGLAGGLAEVVALGVLKFGLDRTLWLGPHVVWMAPTMALAFAVVAGGVPALLLLSRFPHVAVVLATSVPTFLAAWAVLLLVPGLHRYAATFLAAAVAVQMAWFGLRHPDRLVRAARLLLPPLVLVVMALGAGIAGWQLLRERARLAALPTPAAREPNVLLIVLDTQRAASLGLHGYGRPTSPNLERLARSGVVFDRAVSTSSWTLPAHATMFTGYYPHQLTASWRVPFDAEHPTLAEALADRGYGTAGFVANGFYCGFEYGLHRGFHHYDDYVPSAQEWLINSSLGRQLGRNRRIRHLLGYYDIFARPTARDINNRLLRWLDRTPHRPFFAFLNYFDVHHAYLPPPPFDDLYGTRKDRPFTRFTHGHRFSGIPREGWSQLTPEEARAEQDAYDGAVQYLDHQLGRLFEELESRGLLDSTLVIVTSDHGEQFGEHGLFDHGNSLYIQVTHVPLLLRLPGRVPAGVRVPEPVSLRDLPATILELAGPAGEPALPGIPLSGRWLSSGGGSSGSPVLSSMVVFDTASHSLIAGRYHYIRSEGAAGEALFDLDADPHETRNLLNAHSAAEPLAFLRATMDSLLADSVRRAPGATER